jgi:hypothetical protein
MSGWIEWVETDPKGPFFALVHETSLEGVEDAWIEEGVLYLEGDAIETKTVALSQAQWQGLRGRQGTLANTDMTIGLDVHF